MLEINEYGNVIKQSEQKVIFTGRTINSISVIENIGVDIAYTDISEQGNRDNHVRISFDDYRDKLEPVINDLICRQ